MLKDYLIKAYAYLVKVNVWDLNPVEGSTKRIVPEEYRTVVAKYVATGEITS
ncbi:CD1375 family protein [Anaerovorax odorimutans]|uniref:CD1375 family protein n=1 Tax=Anaerovorax odorimutans TaxID=109327 RepID=UPI00041B771C|nr:CD1375 family protein [Anaerovorax odorimutans]